jgi:hypothetical protein
MDRADFVNLICAEPLINGRYSSLELISDKGTFSCLFKGVDTLTGDKVAIKFFDPNHSTDTYRMQCFDR